MIEPGQISFAYCLMPCSPCLFVGLSSIGHCHIFTFVSLTEGVEFMSQESLITNPSS